MSPSLAEKKPLAQTEEQRMLEPVLRTLTPLNRTIVSDDMEKSSDLLDQAVGFPAKRYRYPSGQEYGSWIVPPSWNVREAFLSDGDRIIASTRDHPLFLAPYSMPFEGWVSREELVRDHLIVSDRFDDAFAYQHRLACDFQKRLKQWQISIPRNTLASLNLDRYFVKIDVEIKPGTLNVLEYTAQGEEETAVAILAHLCHPGQANDGLSGVIAGAALIRRLQARPHRFTYKLLVFPETLGSVIHVIAQGLSPAQIRCAVFLETMGAGERLYLKKSRTGQREIDWAIDTIAQEQPEVGVLPFTDGYGNDEFIFDFANVDIPSVGVQYYPFHEYHTSRDTSAIIRWDLWARAIRLTEELFSRVEANRLVQLKFPGPPYLSRYHLYADSIGQRDRFHRIWRLLMLCDGRHSILHLCRESGLPFHDVIGFCQVLDQAGLLAP